ncbi:hypothetical protein QBC47DRAFT_348471 [Echria macrotheca]|uniref:RING-type E3 ubiquitin transferase n=1 Tax=Echria macrotheca TaxID=438768 RepID=A0AAJ0B7G0_9PEZI|nr:hypothetical protein QBC47DRAFT_348471 [Echria macrotheca]
MAEPSEAADDIQSKVFQTTLAEISSSRQDNTEQGECCVICLDTISEPSTALPCAHNNFDFVCLLSWLQERATCPLCKANVYKVRYEDAKDGEAIYRVPNAIKARKTNDALPDARPITEESLNERRRRRRRPDPPTQEVPGLSRPAEAIDRRRHIYRHQLYSLHVGSNRKSRYRPSPTPKDFTTTPHLVSRARLWIRRELQVFAFLSSSSSSPSQSTSPSSSSPRPSTTTKRREDNAEFLLEYIIAILKTVDLQGSAGQAEGMLSDFLGQDNARLFLHELRNWLRSPCASLVAWDREVQYPEENRQRHKRRVPDGREGEGEEEGEEEGGRREDGSRTWRDLRGGDHWRASPGLTMSQQRDDGGWRGVKRCRRREDDVSPRPRGRVSHG